MFHPDDRVSFQTDQMHCKNGPGINSHLSWEGGKQLSWVKYVSGEAHLYFSDSLLFLTWMHPGWSIFDSAELLSTLSRKWKLMPGPVLQCDPPNNCKISFGCLQTEKTFSGIEKSTLCKVSPRNGYIDMHSLYKGYRWLIAILSHRSSLVNSNTNLHRKRGLCQC